MIIKHHNELRDTIRDLTALVCRYVHHEPIIQDSFNEHDALVDDLEISGVWQPQAEAIFDIRVIDTDAQSYQSHHHVNIKIPYSRFLPRIEKNS